MLGAPYRRAEPGAHVVEVSEVDRIEFFFDPMCPYAYQASKWIREVRAATGLTIDWRFFSLEEVNLEAGKRHPWERPWSFGFGQMRVGAVLRRHSQAALDRWYETVGVAFHEEGVKTHDPAVHREIVAALGFPDAVDEALADDTTLTEVRADHERATGELAGWGVPILVFPDGTPIFGPVVVPSPTGEHAHRLWELVVAWTEFPHLYELQRPKGRDDLVHVAEAFRPYLEARDWRSYANPTP